MLKAARAHGMPMMVIAMMTAAITQGSGHPTAAEDDPQDVEQEGQERHDGLPDLASRCVEEATPI